MKMNEIILAVGDTINMNELIRYYEQGYRGEVVYDTELRQVVITLIRTDGNGVM